MFYPYCILCCLFVHSSLLATTVHFLALFLSYLLPPNPHSLLPTPSQERVKAETVLPVLPHLPVFIAFHLSSCSLSLSFLSLYFSFSFFHPHLLSVIFSYQFYRWYAFTLFLYIHFLYSFLPSFLYSFLPPPSGQSADGLDSFFFCMIAVHFSLFFPVFLCLRAMSGGELVCWGRWGKKMTLEGTELRWRMDGWVKEGQE